MKVRSQSGTELISTFGIALVIIAVAIAILLVFSSAPAQLLPSSCSIYGTAKCSDVAYGTNSLGVTTLVVLASSQVHGTINVSGFNAVVGGVKSTSGYCSNNLKKGGPSLIPQGQSIYCVATFPNNAVLSQNYAGTFSIKGNYCSGTVTCSSASSPYNFSGSFSAHATAVSLTTTSSSTTSSSTTSTSSTSSTTTSSTTTTIPPLSISLLPPSNVIWAGGNVLFTNITSGGTPPYSFSYYTNSISYSISGNTITFISVGTFNVVEFAYDKNGLSATSQNSIITVNAVPTTTTTSTSTTTSLSTSVSTSVSTSIFTTTVATTSIVYTYYPVDANGYASAYYQYSVEGTGIGYCPSFSFSCPNNQYTNYFRTSASTTASCPFLGGETFMGISSASGCSNPSISSGSMSCYGSGAGSSYTCSCSGSDQTNTFYSASYYDGDYSLPVTSLSLSCEYHN